MTNEEFKLLVPDLNMRRYIRGGITKNTFNSVYNLMLICNNALTLTFFYSYALYRKQLSKEGLNSLCSEYNANALRVIDTMQKVFLKYPVSLELMQFVLLDIQFDIMRGDYSSLSGCIPDALSIYGNFSLVEYNQVITKIKKSDRYIGESGLDLSKAEWMLRELLEHLPFLKTRELICVSEKNGILKEYVFRKKKRDYSEDDEVPVCYALNNFSNDESRSEFLFLQEMSSCSEGLRLRYASPSFNTYKAVFATDENNKGKNTSLHENVIVIDKNSAELFSEIVGIDVASAEGKAKKLAKVSAISDVYSINYRYVKNLALSISDAISLESLSDVKDSLKAEYQNKYPDAFEAVLERNGVAYENWDSIITMLLIEAGPTQVIQLLIEKNHAFYKIVVKNLSQRFGPSYCLYSQKDKEGELNALAFKLIDNNSSKNSTQLSLLDSSPAVEKLRAGLLAEAKANVILNSLIDIDGQQRKTSLIYIGNLQTKIRLLQDALNTDDFDKKVRYIQYTLGETLKQLICFYKGVYAYGREKLEYDYISFDKYLDVYTINIYKQNTVNAFMRAAKSEAEVIKNDESLRKNSIILLMKRFLDVCDLCYSENSNSNGNNSEGRYLFSALGKYEILDKQKIVSHIPFSLEQELVFTEKNIGKFIDFSSKFLEFFKTGSFGNEGKMNKALFAIYPFVARLCRGNENKDGYKTITFQLSVDVENDGRDNYFKEVNVLSEFDYDLDEKYYCLPNLERSNDKWWIDPLFINYREFNALLED